MAQPRNQVSRTSLNGSMVDPNTFQGAKAVADAIKSGALQGPQHRKKIAEIAKALKPKTYSEQVIGALFDRGHIRDNAEARDAVINAIDPNTRFGAEIVRSFEKNHYLTKYPAIAETLRAQADPNNKYGARCLQIFDRIPDVGRSV